MERDLSNNDEHLLLANLPVLLWAADANGRYHWFNRSWLKFTGLDLPTAAAEGPWQAIHEEDHEMVAATLALATEDQTSFQLEYRLRNAEGDYHWILDRSVPRRNSAGQCTGYLGVGVDVSHQYAYRERLQKRESELRRLHQINEQERTFFSYAVHDGLLQDIIGAEMLLQSLPGSEPSRTEEKVLRIREALRSSIAHGRKLISELRPIILDEHGLAGAVEFYAMELENRGKLRVMVDAAVAIETPTRIWEGNVFRILQEALNNVETHSGSDRANVRLRTKNGELLAEVVDYGTGFDATSASNSFGLRGMYERAEIYGGSLKIHSGPDGTQVRLAMPLPRS